MSMTPLYGESISLCNILTVESQTWSLLEAVRLGAVRNHGVQLSAISSVKVAIFTMEDMRVDRTHFVQHAVNVNGAIEWDYKSSLLRAGAVGVYDI